MSGGAPSSIGTAETGTNADCPGEAPLARGIIAPMRRLGLLTAAVAVCMAMTPGRAYAQAGPAPKTAPISAKDRYEAKRLFNQAHLAYKNGDYEEAILKWQQSYELSKEPLIFESIANAYERLGNMRRALENLKQWRQVAPWREQSTLDGRLQRLEERVNLEDEEQRKKDEEQRKKDEEQRQKLLLAQRQRDDEARAASTGTVVGWSLLGVGGALVVSGVALDLYAAQLRPDANLACAPSGTASLCLDSQRTPLERSSTLALAGDVGWIAGAAMSTAGLVVLLSSSGRDASTPGTEAHVRATPVIASTGIGVLLNGNF